MNSNLIKKLASGVLACCLCGGIFAVSNIAPANDTLSAYALSYDKISGTVNNVTYHKLSDHIEIHGLAFDFDGTELNIPEKIDGLPVTVIGDYAFNSETLTSVTIPKTVTTIKEFAFYGCKGLKSVTLPDSVTSIGYVAFARCENLESVSLGKNVKTIEDSAFSFCKKLKKINIPDSVTAIPYGAFQNCESLESIVLPSSVSKIGEFAFSDCKKLNKITIENPKCEIYASQLTINSSTESIANIVFNGTICGSGGSTAEAYANKYGYKFKAVSSSSSKPVTPSKPVVPTVNNATFGDPNGDEMIDSSDASLVLVEYSSLSTGGGSLFTKSMTAAADVNKDDTVDSSDASLILQYYAYLSTGGKEKNMEKWLQAK